MIASIAEDVRGSKTLAILYDLRDPEAVKRFHNARGFWQGASDIKALDEDRCYLIVDLERAWEEN